MNIFEKYIKIDNFDEKGLMIKLETEDIQYFNLEELYQAIEGRIIDKIGNMIKNAEEKVDKDTEILMRQLKNL